MIGGAAVLEVLNGGLEQEEKKEEEDEDEDVRVRKKRRVGDKEERTSELRAAIKELSLVCTDENHVSTSALLTVSNLLLLVLDKVVPTMAVLRKDIQRNIERLENLYVLNPSVYSNLLEILKKEVNEDRAKRHDSCSRSVVWLTRSMNFGLNLMEKLANDSELSLEEAVEEAYSINCKPWHGWISSAAYKVALKLIPDRKNFNELLMGQGQDHNLLKNDMQILIPLLQPFLNEIHSHLKAFQLDKFKSN